MRADVSGHQGISIGSRLRDEIRTEAAAGTAAIVDDDRLAPALDKFLRHGARQDVHRTTGCKRHNPTHRLVWISRCGLGEPIAHQQMACDEYRVRLNAHLCPGSCNQTSYAPCTAVAARRFSNAGLAGNPCAHWI